MVRKMTSKIALTALQPFYRDHIEQVACPGYAPHWIYTHPQLDLMTARVIYNRVVQHRLWICDDLHIRFSGPMECGEELCLQPQHAITPYTEIRLCKRGHVQEGDNLIHYQVNGYPRTRCRVCRREQSRKDMSHRRPA